MSSDIPQFLIEKGIRIIVKKCKHGEEKVSDIAFNCFSAFFNFSISPDIFLDCFSDLLNKENPKHVKYRAIIALCSFVEHRTQLNWDAKMIHLSFMKKTFQDLDLLECKAWTKKDTGLAEKCISSLLAFRDTPDIINELLPPATNVTEKHIEELINVYRDTILKLGDSSRFKRPMTALICRQIERLLKEDNIDKRIKEEILPGLINYFNPNRKTRLSSPRVSFPRKVSISSLDVSQEFISGQTKDISDTGLYFKLQGYLLYAPYQERVPRTEGFRLQVDNKILKLSTIVVRIFEANDIDVWIEAKAEVLRAWIEKADSPTLMTGFGVNFVDYDKAKITSYLESLNNV